MTENSNKRVPIYVISKEGLEKQEWTPPHFSRGVKQIIEKAHEKVFNGNIPLGAAGSMISVYTRFIDLNNNPLKEEKNLESTLTGLPHGKFEIFIDPTYLHECKPRTDEEPKRNCSPCLVRHTYFLVGRFLKDERLDLQIVGKDEGNRLSHLLGPTIVIDSEIQFEALVAKYVADLNKNVFAYSQMIQGSSDQKRGADES